MTIFVVNRVGTIKDQKLGNFKTLEGAYKYITRNLTGKMPDMVYSSLWNHTQVTVGDYIYSITQESLGE